MRRSARNASFLFCGEIGARFLGFLVAAILARRLGIAGFGQIGFAMSIMAYGVIVSKFGFLTIGIRESARDRKAIPGLVNNIISLRMILSIIAVVGIFIFALLVRKEASVKWLLAVFSLCVIAQSFLLEWVFTGIERMEYIAIARVLTNSAYFGLIIALVRSPKQIIMVPIALIIATLLGASVLLVPYVRRFGWLKPKFNRTAWKLLAGKAWPIGIASVLSQLYINFGIVGLALFTTDYETGIYTAAFRLVIFLLMLDRIFQAVFFPVVSRYFREHQDKLPELIGTALRIILAGCLPVSTGVMLLGKPVVLLVFGHNYLSSVSVLQPLVWFLPLSLLSSLAGYSLLAAGRERRFARNTAIGVAIALLLTVIGIGQWGALGAAVAMLIGEACILCLMGYDSLRMVKPKINWHFVIPLLACIPMSVVLVSLRDWNWVIAALVSGVTYIGLLFLGKGITSDDLGLVK
ncbi:hypothetical protein CH330_04320 [candidate division WOR-3 bacterium JGI_Cruoil_03_51_56]|uniref:Uncharacterized protein n=1 Tax=candidate division WOR-3 bacterium JGI_Cruoil_03_51_56 TaxID=1973747 RepID=A0A235BWH3_UNCW3|nr:MAG: hypothetical protein CH330_04320 [candidate division WOR-3 bacterium JGI_Cruoil_03_51_56]